MPSCKHARSRDFAHVKTSTRHDPWPGITARSFSASDRHHLTHTVHEWYFEPKYEEFRLKEPRTRFPATGFARATVIIRTRIDISGTRGSDDMLTVSGTWVSPVEIEKPTYRASRGAGSSRRWEEKMKTDSSKQPLVSYCATARVEARNLPPSCSDLFLSGGLYSSGRIRSSSCPELPKTSTRKCSAIGSVKRPHFLVMPTPRGSPTA